MKKTLYDKIWNEHLVHENKDGSSLIYIDRHLVHEVTSPQAFDGLGIKKRNIWNKDSIFAVSDHNVPTKNRASGIDDKISKLQVDTLIDNCKKHKISYFDLNNINQGIVHVIGPELAITQPGMTLVCGDSHTSTHGALASLAFGIGTSDVEHVLATQCININKEKNFKINITNSLSHLVSSKDLILHIIKKIGTSGGWVKPSSGYAFKNCEKYAQKVVENITSNRLPSHQLFNKRYRWYDSILLDILWNKNEMGISIFEEMFKNNDITEIFKFLDDEGNLLSDLRVIKSFNPIPFLKALLRRCLPKKM